MIENQFDTQLPQATSGMFDLQSTATSLRKRNKDSVRVAHMRAFNEGISPLDAYRNVQASLDGGVDMKSLQEKEQVTYAYNVSQQLRQYMSDNATNPDPAVRETINELHTDFPGVRDGYLDKLDGVDQTFTDMFAGESVEDLRRRQVSGKATVMGMVEQEFEDNSWIENGGNWAADFVAPDNIKDLNDLADLRGLSFKGMVNEMADFQTRDPEVQMEFMRQLMPVLVEAFDSNPTAIRSAVELYYADDIISDIAITGAFDVFAGFDVAALGGIVAVKVASKVAAGRSAIKDLKDLENIDLAATMNTANGADSSDQLHTAMDAMRTDTASNAHPFKMEEAAVVNGAMDGMAAAVQRAKKSITAQSLEDSITSSVYTLSRKEVRALNVTKTRLLKSAGSAGKAGRARILKQIEAIDVSLKDSVDANRFSADLSRLQQGIIPDSYRPVYEQAIREELAKVGNKVAPVDVKQARASAAASRNGDSLSGSDDLTELASTPRLVDYPEEYGLTQDFADLINASVSRPLQRAHESVAGESIQALAPEQRRLVEASVADKIKKAAASTGNNVDSLNISNRTDKGFDVEYVTDGGESTSYTHKFTVADSGALVSDPKLVKASVLPELRKLFSPHVVWREMMDGFMSNVTYADQQSSRLANAMMSKWSDIEKGLSKDSLSHIDSLLMAGDEGGVVYTPRELLDGAIEVKIGDQGFKRQYSQQEVVGYFKKRAFFDELHRMRNELTRDQLDFLGMRGVKYTDQEGVARDLIGKPFDASDSLRADMDKGVVFVPSNSKVNMATFINSKAANKHLMDEGYVPIKLMEPVSSTSGKAKARYALIHPDDVKQLPSQVLRYEAGYVPRIYKPGYHFVKDTSGGTNRTLYAFEKKADADAYAIDLREKGQKVEVKADGEFTDLEKLRSSSDMYGGLYTGHRKATPLMVKGENGDFLPDRMTTSQATQRYIQSVSSIMPMNTYRMAVAEQWVNTVKMLAEREGKEGFGHGKAGFNQPFALSEDSTKLMKESHEHISSSLGIPSDAENYFRNKMMKIGEARRGKVGGDWVLNRVHGDPVRALKGLTFNASLGWFNPAQLYVQAQNMSIAMAVSPLGAPAALGRTLAMRSAILSDNPKVWEKAAKTLGMDAKEFADDIRSFKDTGLLDSINRNADFDSNLTGLGTGTWEGVRKVAKKGLVFYEEGETFARIMAWNIAKYNLKQAGKKITTRSLSDETMRMHMNLQAANAAHWQKGVLGVPTQFLQVFAKFIENAGPGIMGLEGAKWTQAESARILLGQIIMYGTVGVPIAESAAAYIADIAGTDPARLAKEHPRLHEAVEEGMTGLITASLGFDNNFSERGGLLTGLDDNVMVDVLTGLADYVTGGNTDSDVYDLAFGATGNTIGRVSQSVSTMLQAAHNLYTAPSMATLGDETLAIMDSVVGITSTWSNARKAYYAQYYGQGLRSKRGNLIMTTEELGANWPTLIAKGIGFPTDRESSLWAAYQYDMDSKEAKRSTKEAIQHAYLKFTRTGNKDLYRKQVAVYLNAHNPITQKEIMSQFAKSTLDPKSILSKQTDNAAASYLMSGGEDIVPSSAAIIGEQ
jgi:hypothetical protein